MTPRHGAMPHGTPTFTVEELDGEFVNYRPSGSQPLARFDREREVIAAARKIGEAMGVTQMRVVFLIPVGPTMDDRH
jgi:hypothetical protein